MPLAARKTGIDWAIGINTVGGPGIRQEQPPDCATVLAVEQSATCWAVAPAAEGGPSVAGVHTGVRKGLMGERNGHVEIVQRPVLGSMVQKGAGRKFQKPDRNHFAPGAGGSMVSILSALAEIARAPTRTTSRAV